MSDAELKLAAQSQAACLKEVEAKNGDLGTQASTPTALPEERREGKKL